MPGLLMDLDGTIANTLPHLFASFRHAVDPFITYPPEDAEIVATFGPPERDCIRQLLYQRKDIKKKTIAPEDLDRAVRRFHDYYEWGHDAVKAFAGVPELIRLTRQRGWRFGVQTGKSRRSAVFTLERLGLWPDVEYLVSGDDVANPKPAPDGVRKVLREFAIPAAQVIVVGDSPSDIQAGEAAGTKTAAALWGAFDPGALKQAGATWLLEKVEDLRKVIDRFST